MPRVRQEPGRRDAWLSAGTHRLFDRSDGEVQVGRAFDQKSAPADEADNHCVHPHQPLARDERGEGGVIQANAIARFRPPRSSHPGSTILVSSPILV